MTPEDARRLLAGIGITRVCDLDLLIFFFARHSRALLSSDSRAGFLGCDLKDIADSLDVLMAAGLLTRVQTSAHAARLYVFAPDEGTGDWLPSLVALASTREGRLAEARAPREAGAERAQRRKPDSMITSGPRRIVAETPHRRQRSRRHPLGWHPPRQHHPH